MKMLRVKIKIIILLDLCKFPAQFVPSSVLGSITVLFKLNWRILSFSSIHNSFHHDTISETMKPGCACEYTIGDKIEKPPD
jgi:hypothetical protein